MENELKGIKNEVVCIKNDNEYQSVHFREDETRQGKTRTKGMRVQLREGLCHAKPPTRIQPESNLAPRRQPEYMMMLWSHHKLYLMSCHHPRLNFMPWHDPKPNLMPRCQS